MKMTSLVVTIKIEKATLQLLEELREEINAKNFEWGWGVFYSSLLFTRRFS